MDIARDYLALMASVASHKSLPAVKSLHIAPVSLAATKNCKFAALILNDGTVGLTYVGLGDTLQKLNDALDTIPLTGSSALELCQYYSLDQPWQRALGFAAINAISQSVLKEYCHQLNQKPATTDAIEFGAQDHIGMVGFFSPLITQIRALGSKLTVIELDQSLVQSQPGFTVTTDATALNSCTKVLVTGTTLINQTLDNVLAHMISAQEIHLIGPTLGCLPDPLFARGITSVGGRSIVDHEQFLVRWRSAQSWRHSAKRYHIQRCDYPGYKQLVW